MNKWAAEVNWNGTIMVDEIEVVKETPKTYKVEGHRPSTGYRNTIRKEDNILFGTKREAIEALCHRLEKSLGDAINKMERAKAKYNVAINALEEL